MRNNWVWVLLPALIMAGCGLADKKKDDAVDPSASGTGALAVNSAIAGVTFVNSIVSGITVSKPSAGRLNAGVIATAFTPPPTYNCSGGGTINFSGITGTAVNCIENGGTVTANMTISVLPGLVTVVCGTNDLPTSLSAELNGLISIGSVDFTLTSLGMEFSSITYDANCKMASFNVAVTGEMGNSDIDTTVDFGTGSVLFGVIINGNQAEITANGSVTVHTPCHDGSFTMATTQTIIIPEGETCPTSGSVTISGGLSGVVNYPEACTDPACVLGL